MSRRVWAPLVGCIGFKTGDDPFGRAIEEMEEHLQDTLVDKNLVPPSHVFCVGPTLQSGADHEIFEAWLYARTQPLSKYEHYIQRGRVRYYDTGVPLDAAVLAYNKTVSIFKGVPYGVGQIAGHLLVLVAQRLGMDVNSNPFPSGVVCHEVAAWCLKFQHHETVKLGLKSPLEWTSAYNPELSTPAHLEACLRDSHLWNYPTAAEVKGFQEQWGSLVSGQPRLPLDVAP